MIIGIDDPLTKALEANKSVVDLDREARAAEEGVSSRKGGGDAPVAAVEVVEANPVEEGEDADRKELQAAKEAFDAMSAEYRKYIAEKVANLPIVRYRRRAPFNEDEKKLIAAALMARQPLYKVAQTLRCSYAKIDKAIMDDEYLTELALETKRREKEEIEEGIDDCVRARVPAVLMWKAAKIMPEKYGDQVNMDTEDDTRLVIGAIPEDEVAEADAVVDGMKDKIPSVGGVPALIEANEIAAEMAAAGGGVSESPLGSTPAAPAVNPPQGDARFGKFVAAADMNVVDERGNVIENRAGRTIPREEPEPDPCPDNYGLMNDDVTDFGTESWI